MRKNHLAVLLAASMVVSMTACGQKTEDTGATATAAPTTEAATEAPTTEAPTQEKEGTYTAGTYTGTTPGMKGDVTVEVTFDEDSITDVTVKDHVETYGIGYGMSTTPVEVMPEKIVKAQSVNVDSITGATITCMAIKRAVSDCIEQAGGDPKSMAQVSDSFDYQDNMETDVVVVGAGARVCPRQSRRQKLALMWCSLKNRELPEVPPPAAEARCWRQGLHGRPNRILKTLLNRCMII